MLATKVNFRELLRRLRFWLNVQVRNGQLTERGLARLVAMSQSHIHNVLKGARILTPDTADRILKSLGLTVLDFLEPDEAAFSARQDRPPGATAKKPPPRVLRPGRSATPPKRSAPE
jgi:transcriptional regulator with XRE-family HTH domain